MKLERSPVIDRLCATTSMNATRPPNAARNALRANSAPQTVSIDVTMWAAERERVSDRHQST